MDRIVSLIEHKGRIIVATGTAIFDITSGEPVPFTTLELMNKAQMGYKYEVSAIKLDEPTTEKE